MTSKPTSKDALLAAAAAALSKNPGASLSDIAAKAGVGRATLHRHFPARDDLIRALALDCLRQTDAATADIPFEEISALEGVRRVLEAVVPLGDRYHFLTLEPAAAQGAEIAETTARQSAEMAELVEAAKAEGSIAAEVPTAWVTTVFDALVYAAWSAVDEGSVARRDAAALAFRSLTDGLKPKSGDTS